MNEISPLRKAKLERAASLRQPDITIILENVHDPHNIGAVLRSCDSVGLKEVFVLYTESHLNEDHLKLGKRTSSGARKWLDVHLYTDVDAYEKKLNKMNHESNIFIKLGGDKFICFNTLILKKK